MKDEILTIQEEPKVIFSALVDQNMYGLIFKATNSGQGVEWYGTQEEFNRRAEQLKNSGVGVVEKL